MGIVSSQDGANLIAFSKTAIYASTNAAQSWATSSLTGTAFSSVTCSTTCKIAYITANTATGYIYSSTDYGASWSTTGAKTSFYTGVATNEDGSMVAACSYSSTIGNIITSKDFGKTWQITIAPISKWNGIASDLSGSKLIAVVQSGYVYLSTDGGISWNLPSIGTSDGDQPGSFKRVVSNQFGSLYVASTQTTGGNWVSTDAGNLWKDDVDITDIVITGQALSCSGLNVAIAANNYYIQTGVYQYPTSKPTASPTQNPTKGKK